MRNRQKGFSLIELLIVVAIILIIAAIAIPNLLRSRMAANEASAVGSLRTVNTALVTYNSTYGGFPVGDCLSVLAPPAGGGTADATAADLIDAVLATGTKSGYTFACAGVDADGDGRGDTYSIVAEPVTRGTTGQRGFFTDQSGVIRANPDGTADSASTPIT
jgi:prepilin-type N-terminal cleavage/methylation domain-containing protein